MTTNHGRGAGTDRPQGKTGGKPNQAKTGGDGDGRGLDPQGGDNAEMGHGAPLSSGPGQEKTSDAIKMPS